MRPIQGMCGFSRSVLFSTLWAVPLVLLHELGHAAAGLVLTRGRVEVAVGDRPDQLVLEAGRLDLGLSWSLSPGGECRIDSGELRTPEGRGVDRGRRARRLAGGGPWSCSPPPCLPGHSIREPP